MLSQHKALGRRLARAFESLRFEGDARIASYFAWAKRSDLLPLYSPEFRAQLRAATEQPLTDWLAQQPEDSSKLERMLALEQRFFLADHNLVYTDKMSMACGVEVRVPFLDNDLMDFAAGIPDQFKQRGLESKWVLKKAMEPMLPLDVIYRPKTGFGAPLRTWIRQDLREMLFDLLSENNIRRRGLFDPRAVQALIADNESGRKDAAYTLLSLMCIEIWFQRFADSNSVSYSDTLS
jgi:asparagine synthase (glutamine-hydrolysing)